jgi:hypothetical protein
MQLVIGIDQCMALVQPAIDQQMYTTPAFLGIATALEHDVLTSLIDDAFTPFRDVFLSFGIGPG